MGISVDLNVCWNVVEPLAWAAAYDETLRLLRSHPSQLMGYEWRTVLDRKVPYYAKDIEQRIGDKSRWCIVGDRQSMCFAESFELARGGFERSRVPTRLNQAAKHSDIVFGEPGEWPGVRVFGAKTQGHPYHVAIVAAGLLIEAHFPGAALLSGDVDETVVHAAMKWATEVLGRQIPTPILFDKEALFSRLAKEWGGGDLIAAFASRFMGNLVDGLAFVFSTSEAAAVRAYLRTALFPGNAQQADAPDPSDLIRAFLLTTPDVEQLAAIAKTAMPEPVPAEKLVTIIARSGVLLPPTLLERVARCKATPLTLRPDVSSLGSLLGAMYLDHHFGPRIFAEDVLEAALTRAYPGRETELCSLAKEESRRLEGALSQSCDAIDKHAVFHAGLEHYQDVGELVAIQSAPELVPYSQQRLAVFAYVLGKAATPASQKAKTQRMRDLEQARSFMVALASQHGPTLTEYAWDWILKEQDLPVVELLLDLFCCEPGSDEGRRIQRALLENRVLCIELVRMMGDKAVMADAEARMEQAKQAKRCVSSLAAGSVS